MPGLCHWCLSLAILLLSTPAWAQVRTCVHVDNGKDTGGLERLTRMELARHSTHVAVTRNCQAHLRIELIELSDDSRSLTGRMDNEVPHRVEVGKAGIATALERLLTVVLHNDPKRLSGPERDDWFLRQRKAFRERGESYFGLEFYQVSAWVGGGIQSFPGLALSARREVDHVHLGVRLGGASSFAESRELTLAQQFMAHAELALFSSRTAATAGFGALALGLEAQRFTGAAPLYGPSTYGSRLFLGFSPGLRGGVELLRASSSRFQLWTQALFPVFVSRDQQGGIIDQWTPTLSLGVSVLL